MTQCKFEATYPASDECVLNKILDVLVAAVSCPTGGLLTNDNLINIFQVPVGPSFVAHQRGMHGRAEPTCDHGPARLGACTTVGPESSVLVDMPCMQACYRIGHFQTEKGRDTSGESSRQRQSWVAMRQLHKSAPPCSSLSDCGSAPTCCRLQSC